MKLGQCHASSNAGTGFWFYFSKTLKLYLQVIAGVGCNSKISFSFAPVFGIEPTCSIRAIPTVFCFFPLISVSSQSLKINASNVLLA